jgi:8-oxo-dGTP diphosphatase
VGKLHVVAAIIVADGQVLACRRASHKASGGLWEFPGGKVEVGEMPAPALERELFEELGLVAKPTWMFDKSATMVHDNLTVLLECLIVPVEEVFHVVSSDHDDFIWLAPGELSNLNWATPDLPAVSKLAAMTTFTNLANLQASVRPNIGKGLIS